MGRNWNGAELSKNVRVYTANGREPRVTIRFTHQGVECQELDLPVGQVANGAHLDERELAITEASIKTAAETLARLRDRIKHGDFDYASFFPGSTRAKVEAVVDAESPDQITIGTVLDRYLIEVAKTTRPQTVAMYAQQVRNWIRPYWGHQKASALTRGAVRAWLTEIRDGELLPLNNRAQRGEIELTAGTARQILRPLLGAIDCPKNDKVFKSGNPLARAGLVNQVWKTKRAQKGKQAGDYNVVPFNKQEWASIMAVASPYWQSLLTFWYWTGLRMGELFALKADKINWDTETISIHRTWVCVKGVKGGVLQEDVKTSSSWREVPLLGAAQRILRDRVKELAQAPRAHGFIWTKEGGAVCTKPSQFLSAQFESLLRKADAHSRAQGGDGVPYRNAEQMRHTFASHMFERGELPGTVSKIMGHVNEQITREVYAKMIKDSDTKHGFTLRGDYSETA